MNLLHGNIIRDYILKNKWAWDNCRIQQTCWSNSFLNENKTEPSCFLISICLKINGIHFCKIPVQSACHHFYHGLTGSLLPTDLNSRLLITLLVQANTFWQVSESWLTISCNLHSKSVGNEYQQEIREKPEDEFILLKDSKKNSQSISEWY